MDDFDEKWGSSETRMKLVPGKEVISVLNGYLQPKFKIAISANALVATFNRSEGTAKFSRFLTSLKKCNTDVTEQTSLSLGDT